LLQTLSPGSEPFNAFSFNIAANNYGFLSFGFLFRRLSLFSCWEIFRQNNRVQAKIQNYGEAREFCSKSVKKMMKIILVSSRNP
jgi:hypothetical protein